MGEKVYPHNGSNNSSLFKSDVHLSVRSAPSNVCYLTGGLIGFFPLDFICRSKGLHDVLCVCLGVCMFCITYIFIYIWSILCYLIYLYICVCFFPVFLMSNCSLRLTSLCPERNWTWLCPHRSPFLSTIGFLLLSTSPPMIQNSSKNILRYVLSILCFRNCFLPHRLQVRDFILQVRIFLQICWEIHLLFSWNMIGNYLTRIGCVMPRAVKLFLHTTANESWKWEHREKCSYWQSVS